MITGNQRKAELLGMPFGTASSRLKKELLYDMAKRLNEDFCYRCKVKITTIEEFSIEHIKSWMGSANPKEAFFNLDNIAFSHLSCNVADGERNRKYVSVEEKVRAKIERRRNDPARYERHLAQKRKESLRDHHKT